MKTLATITTAALLAAASVAGAEEKLRDIRWSEMPARALPEGARVEPADGDASHERLVVTNAGGERRITVLTIGKPGITRKTYSLRGRVRCEGVEGKAYLEMWNHFEGGHRYFTRTLGDSGPLAALSGTSGWRYFALPFHVRKAPGMPTKLVVNVVFAGKGTVRLSPMRLAQFAPGEDPAALPGQWWSGRVAGVLGGVMGVVLGGLGAAIGVLSSKGIGRRFALAATRAMTAVGVASLVLCAVAVLKGQPYAVYYPLGLVGVLCTVLPLGLTRVLRRRYEQVELQKMRVADAAG